jgi:anti-anti-sigma factor
MSEPPAEQQEFVLSSTMESVAQVEAAAEQLAAEAGLDQDERDNVALAIREAAINAVLHGNDYDPAKRITVSLRNTGAELIFTITDQGNDLEAGFDPDSLSDPLAPEKLLRGCGRGILIIRCFMDEVSFRQLKPGTELTLVKHLIPGQKSIRCADEVSSEDRGVRQVEVSCGAVAGAETLQMLQPYFQKGGITVAHSITSREVDGVTVLDLNGRITLGEGSVRVREAIRDFISKGSKNILLNLGNIDYIDSSGLGELVSAYTTARNQAVALKLLNLTKKVHDLLQVTKLYTVFDIFDDEASAIASFK